MSTPISVVVPTRDRPAALARCLAALARQDAARIQVVVVDDGSADRGALARSLETLPGARLVRSPGRGPAAARNLGARAADGEVVCFTDDDCAPEPGWARHLAAACLARRAAAGATLSEPGAPALVRASQAITEHLLCSSLDPGGATVGFAPTSSLGAVRELLAGLPFDESFPNAAGEDRDWCARLAASGIEIAWAPEAVVIHRPALGARAFARQQFRYGEGAARYRAAAPGRRRLGDARFYAGLIRAGFRQGPGAGGAVLAAQLLTLAGVAAQRARGSAASRAASPARGPAAARRRGRRPRSR